MTGLSVGLNLLYLTTRAAGIGRYARELVPALLTEEPGLRLTAFHSRELPSEVRAAPWADEVEWVGLPVTVTRGPPWNAALTLSAQWAAEPLLARRRRLSVLHGPANVGPIAAPGAARVVTIFDLIWMRHRETLDRRSTLAMRAVVPPAARRAHRVVVPSEVVRRDVAERLAVPRERIAVVPLGVRADTAAAPAPAAVRAAHRLGNASVILCVAQMRAHKNLAGLLRALAIVADCTAIVVLPGEPTPHEGELRGLAAGLGVSDRVRFCGWLADADLEGLFNVASCVVVPSFDEGFGLPVLEAMARGVPVGCSNMSSLPEVAGDAALLFDPRKPDSIAAVIDVLLTDSRTRAELVARGRERAARHTWQATARGTLDAYRRAIEERDRA